MVVFGPFRLDLAEERLWKGTSQLAVRRKPFALLKYLATNPQRLVTHAELLEHVWEGAVVSESTVRTQLHELRQVLGEGVIETVIGRGYRFTAEIGDAGSPEVVDRIVVGRDRELAALKECLARADAGHRQICFVTGEPGIGKTTIVDAFVDGLPDDVIVARGHCVEQHGTPESYLAIIELFSRLRQSEHAQRTLDALMRNAPMFLAHVPQLAPAEIVDKLRERSHEGSEARMVRELVDAIEALSQQATLVLVLEDLHWSDVATLDLLAILGARRERARLLVVATSRRVEARTTTHPLNPVMRNLVARSRATLVALERVAADDIRQLLALRFAANAFPETLVETLEHITAGTPLFLVSVLDDLEGRSMLAQQDGTWKLTVPIDDVRAHRPTNVKQLIDIRLDRLLATEQRVLEAAAVVGAEFSSGLVAAALDMSAEDVDDICDGLARRQLFLRRVPSEPWPDGTLYTHYGVTHALVQEVCLARSAPARRARWHRSVAEHLERGYGPRADDVALPLAMHFEQGQVVARAVHYYLVAGDRTAMRFANRDAATLFQRALDLQARMPEGLERDDFEIHARGGLVTAILRVETPPQAISHLARMIELARKIDDKPRLCAALLGEAFRLQLSAQHRDGQRVCAEMTELTRDPAMPIELARFAQAMIALNKLWRGEIAGVAEAFQSILDDGDLLERSILDILGPTDRRTIVTGFLACAHFCLGDHARAKEIAERAVTRATKTTDPITIAYAHCNLAFVRLVSGDATASVRAAAERALELGDIGPWRFVAEVFAACDRDDGRAEERLREFRARIPSLAYGTTRVGVGVIYMLRKAGVDARPLANELMDFAKLHDERMLEPLLRDLAS